MNFWRSGLLVLQYGRQWPTSSIRSFHRALPSWSYKSAISLDKLYPSSNHDKTQVQKVGCCVGYGIDNEGSVLKMLGSWVNIYDAGPCWVILQYVPQYASTGTTAPPGGLNQPVSRISEGWAGACGGILYFLFSVLGT